MRVGLIAVLMLLWPAAEIAGFILVGQKIGVLSTLALLVLVSVVGIMVLRQQGFGILTRLTAASSNDATPGKDLVHGALILFAGILLLLPGFLSDILALLLLLPPVRELIIRYFGRNVVVFSSRMRPEREARNTAPQVIDLEEQEYRYEINPRSPWNKDKGPET